MVKSFWKARTKEKYSNQSSLCALGHSHRSKLESAVCGIIQWREKAGELELIGAEIRVRVCGPEGHECSNEEKIEYIPDFKCKDPITGEIWYAEAKGVETEVFRIKRRLWLHNNLPRLEIWKGTWQKPYLHEVIGG